MTDTAKTHDRKSRDTLCRGAGALATVALLGTSGCVVTRLARPAYQGTVVDSATQTPLQGV